jgi:hypothetical protein
VPDSAAWPAGSGRGNEQKAAVAVAHTLGRIAWTVMHDARDYTEAGEDYNERLDQRNRDRRRAASVAAWQRASRSITWD